ncbi:unnamed protein product [Rhizopus microsporus]|uniref:Integral membrane protein n=1 Tax=Rhizopus microsporus ATCC 52813 TaxID=1340429 RepID=A0A2G4SP35_RHIZD|nr:uncharacterized protein RHIMIDRAFT_239375 [Rhizopus microsporus ATCC 52813]PHZ10548.1 hypothetical protein RHIMIDRAFT_239375 [Rhizopus microsporus ATCC 52813]CEG81949.1 hypothetical protein RMATCC62417_16086 [Rhizopus microsporus]
MSVPNDYKSAPSWPSLYWPFQPGYNPLVMVADKEHSLYYINDIWRFTMIWSLLFSLVVYLPAGVWAFMMFAKSRTLNWYTLMMIPFLFVIGGAIASFVIGSIIGVAIAIVYNAGFFVMSTWIPFLWALIHILIVIIGSYSTITAIL